MGNSQTGEAESDKMVYGALKCYLWFKQLIINQEGKFSNEYGKNVFRILANPSATKNLISVDDVVEASLRVREKGDLNITYNLVNPVTTTVGEIRGSIFKTIGVDFFVLDLSVEKGEMSKWERLIYRATKIYKPYMLQDDPNWDISNTLRIMGKNKFHKFNPELQCKLYKNYIDKCSYGIQFIQKRANCK